MFCGNDNSHRGLHMNSQSTPTLLALMFLLWVLLLTVERGGVRKYAFPYPKSQLCSLSIRQIFGIVIRGSVCALEGSGEEVCVEVGGDQVKQPQPFVGSVSAFREHPAQVLLLGIKLIIPGNSFRESQWNMFGLGRNKQSSGAVWKSRWTSWAPVPNKPLVSVDVKQHFNLHGTNSDRYASRKNANEHKGFQNCLHQINVRDFKIVCTTFSKWILHL